VDAEKTIAEETVLIIKPETTISKAKGEDLAHIVFNVTYNAGIVKMLEEKSLFRIGWRRDAPSGWQ
jgi:hypothetical protein